MLRSLAALLFMPGMAMAAPYIQDGCAITVPDGWVASKSRVATPDKKLWAELMQAPTTAEIVQIETRLGAKPVSEDSALIVLMSSASYGGLTNKQFHAITKTSPSCLADVTVPAGAQEEAARKIAMTVAPAK